MIITEEMFDLAVEAEAGLVKQFSNHATEAALQLCKLVIQEYAVISAGNNVVTDIKEAGEPEAKLV